MDYSIKEEFNLQSIKKSVENDQNLSRIYGFILYTNRDAFVAKVLNDDYFLMALDAISGSNWPIYAVRPLIKGSYEFPHVKPGTIGMMRLIWEEPDANIPILYEFGINNSESLPCFVAFMWDDSGVLHKVSIPIYGNNETDVFNSIKRIVEVITNTEQKVLSEYKHNVELFNNVSDEFAALHCEHTLGTSVKIGKKLLDFIKIFM